jgi:hypothetical protein
MQDPHHSIQKLKNIHKNINKLFTKNLFPKTNKYSEKLF